MGLVNDNQKVITALAFGDRYMEPDAAGRLTGSPGSGRAMVAKTLRQLSWVESDKERVVVRPTIQADRATRPGVMSMWNSMPSTSDRRRSMVSDGSC